MEENQASASQEQKGSNPSLVIGIIVVIVVIAGAFWLMSNNKNQSAQTQQQTQTQIQTTVTQEPAATGSESASQGDAMAAKDITVEGGSFYFKPNEITVKKGDKVKITLKNSGGMHNFVIDKFNVHSDTISTGTTTVEFTPDKTGTFEFYCAVGNHRQMGMKGNLIVQ